MALHTYSLSKGPLLEGQAVHTPHCHKKNSGINGSHGGKSYRFFPRLIAAKGTYSQLVSILLKDTVIDSLSLFGGQYDDNSDVVKEFCVISLATDSKPLKPTSLRVANVDVSAFGTEDVPIDLSDLQELIVHECHGGEHLLDAASGKTDQLRKFSFIHRYQHVSPAGRRGPVRLPQMYQKKMPKKKSKLTPYRPPAAHTYDAPIQGILRRSTLLEEIAIHVCDSFSFSQKSFLEMIGPNLRLLSLLCGGVHFLDSGHIGELAQRCPNLRGLGIGVTPASNSAAFTREMTDIGRHLASLHDFHAFVAFTKLHTSPFSRSADIRLQYPDPAVLNIKDLTTTQRTLLHRAGCDRLKYVSSGRRNVEYEWPWQPIEELYTLHFDDTGSSTDATMPSAAGALGMSREDKAMLASLGGVPLRHFDQYCRSVEYRYQPVDVTDIRGMDYWLSSCRK